MITINNIKSVSDSYLCSNCGACKVICHKRQISFKFSNIGRKYALVGDECVQCGLCRKVCPSLNDEHGYKVNYEGNIKSIVIARSQDKSIYQNSQSGGATTALLSYLFDEGLIQAAVVCVMSFGKTPIVKGKVVRSKSELYSSQKSCYTPVDLLSALEEIDSSIDVALVGLPCHIEGLNLIQKISKKYLNIKYKFGLICDRTLCAGIQNAIASFNKHTSDILFHWRKKDFYYDGILYTYEKAPVVILDSEGYETVVPNYVRFSLKDMFTSPRCRVCNDKLNIFADIVLGDPWGMKGCDMLHGDSVLIIRSKTGLQIYKDALEKNYIIKQCDGYYEDLLNGQGIKNRRHNSQVARKALSAILGNHSEFSILRTSESISEQEVIKTQVNIRDFIRLDKASEKEVLEQAHKQIAATERAIRLNKSVIIRALLKIKSSIGL